MAAPTMREHRRGPEPKTERAERAGLKVRKPTLPAESPREQPRRARDRQNVPVRTERSDDRAFKSLLHWQRDPGTARGRHHRRRNWRPYLGAGPKKIRGQRRRL